MFGLNETRVYEIAAGAVENLVRGTRALVNGLNARFEELKEQVRTDTCKFAEEQKARFERIDKIIGAQTDILNSDRTAQIHGSTIQQMNTRLTTALSCINSLQSICSGQQDRIVKLEFALRNHDSFQSQLDRFREQRDASIARLDHVIESLDNRVLLLAGSLGADFVPQPPPEPKPIGSEMLVMDNGKKGKRGFQLRAEPKGQAGCNR